MDQHLDHAALRNHGKETILVADDDPFVRDVILRILRQAGYSTTAANDGAAAIALVEEHGELISLAILDVVMPRMDGRDAYRRIRVIRPQIKVVFCTGYDPGTEKTKFIKKNDVALLEKPLAPHSLLRKVRELLDAEGEQAASFLSPFPEDFVAATPLT